MDSDATALTGTNGGEEGSADPSRGQLMTSTREGEQRAKCAPDQRMLTRTGGEPSERSDGWDYVDSRCWASLLRGS
jgi:hypothetical protein